MNQFSKLKIRLGSCWQTTSELFIEYSDHSSVHGIRYVVEKGRVWFEKVWWIAALCISAIFCGKLVANAWNTDPIIISFTAKPTPIWQIPFPAVTICPTIFAQSKIMNLTSMFQHLEDENYLNEFTKNEKFQLLALSKFCPKKLLQKRLNRYGSCNGCLEKLREIRIPPNEIFAECKFHNQLINCSASFKELALDFALCYTFNGVEIFREDSETPLSPSNEWSIDQGYKPTAPLDVHPRRALRAGSLLGLSVLLKINKSDIDFECYANPGFWVEYRMPSDVPQFLTNFFNIRMKSSMTFTLKPKMIMTTNELRDYSLKERSCVFSNERRLKYFNQYTQSNCEIECVTEYILRKCGCLQMLQDRKRNASDHADICGPYYFKCILYYKSKLFYQYLKPCGCLPGCSSISYESEVAATSLNMSNQVGYQKEYEYTRLKFYFKESQFMRTQRAILYGKSEFLANCGGLLGLCLGISVMSILEIVYFCTIRVCCKLRWRDGSTVTFVEDLQYFPIKSSRFLQMTRNLTLDYSTKTSIQGIKYVADPHLSVGERLWWVSVVMVSIFCCGSLIYDALKRYDQFPLIISYANEESGISQIPFPAVTICPQVVSLDIAAVFQFFRVQNLSLYEFEATDIEAITALAQVCDPEVFGDIDPEGMTNCENCSEYLSLMLGHTDSVFSRCGHLHTNEICSELFEPVMTELGVCFKYNGLEVHRSNISSIEEWTLEEGYRKSTGNMKVYPRTGSKFPLTVDLEVENRLNDGLCKGPIQGFKVFLHLPNEAPQISNHYYLVPYKQTVEISIIPKMIFTAPELRDISVHKRRCYFNDERYLRFFKYYTQNNCELECLANLTVSKCGCQRFHLPRIPGVKFCGISDIKCYQTATQHSVEQKINLSESSVCDCLPACTSLSYDTEINQISMDDAAIGSYNRDRNYGKNVSIAELFISFRENRFVVLKRSRLYGKTEFLAKCGGLLSLFLGFSVMSIVELVYFCTIRLFCSMRTQITKGN